VPRQRVDYIPLIGDLELPRGCRAQFRRQGLDGQVHRRSAVGISPRVDHDEGVIPHEVHDLAIHFRRVGLPKPRARRQEAVGWKGVTVYAQGGVALVHDQHQAVVIGDPAHPGGADRQSGGAVHPLVRHEVLGVHHVSGDVPLLDRFHHPRLFHGEQRRGDPRSVDEARVPVEELLGAVLVGQLEAQTAEAASPIALLDPSRDVAHPVIRDERMDLEQIELGEGHVVLATIDLGLGAIHSPRPVPMVVPLTQDGPLMDLAEHLPQLCVGFPDGFKPSGDLLPCREVHMEPRRHGAVNVDKGACRVIPLMHRGREAVSCRNDAIGPVPEALDLCPLVEPGPHEAAVGVASHKALVPTGRIGVDVHVVLVNAEPVPRGARRRRQRYHAAVAPHGLVSGQDVGQLGVVTPVLPSVDLNEEILHPVGAPRLHGTLGAREVAEPVVDDDAVRQVLDPGGGGARDARQDLRQVGGDGHDRGLAQGDPRTVREGLVPRLHGCVRARRRGRPVQDAAYIDA